MRKLVSINGALFFSVMVCLRGLSFKIESFRFLLHNLKTTRWDQLFIVLHVGLWFALPLASLGMADTITNYTLVTLFAGPYVGSVLLLNHVGMSAVRSHSAIHPLQRITRTTRNLGSSRWNDFIFGGVNNHIEHHLFLDIPTVRLPTARRITRDFCRRHNLTYNETGYFRAIAEVTSYFRKLSPHLLASESLT